MIINWKHLATTPGYKSLKAAYIRDVKDAADDVARGRRPMRDKAVFLRHFNWVINRAKHYAHRTGKSIEDILNEWEEKRTDWWLNCYQNCRQPKFHSNSKKPAGVNGTRKYYKKSPFYTAQNVKNQVSKFIQAEHMNNCSKKKKRWSMARKRRGY